MKLYYSPTSPYVRKVMACAIARGIEDRNSLDRDQSARLAARPARR